MLVAKFKIWLAIKLIKALEVSPRHPKRTEALDCSDIDEALVCLRENKLGVTG
jgi:hypothetical protein